MKRINLIPADIRKENNARAKRRGFIFFCVLIIALLAGYWNIQVIKINQYNKDVALKKKRVRMLESSLDEKKASYEQIVKELDNVALNKKIVTERIGLLANKSSKGKAVSKVLTTISALIPEEIWLKKIVINGDIISIKGETYDNIVVGSFMKKLDDDNIFEKTDFKYIQKVETDLNSFIDFEITSQIKIDTL